MPDVVVTGYAFGVRLQQDFDAVACPFGGLLGSQGESPALREKGPRFDECVRRMRQFTIGARRYGGGRSVEQATRYYLDHLVEACAERARRGCSGLPDHVDPLISVTEFCPRTTILAFKVLRPRRLVVIPSESARSAFAMLEIWD